MMKLDIARLCIETVRPLEVCETSWFRGCIAANFPEYDLLHNHNRGGGSVYRYPAIQFKIINGLGVIVAVRRQAIKILQQIFCSFPSRLRIGNKTIEVQKRTMEVSREDFGLFSESLQYQFLTPWFALNEKNASKYEYARKDEATALLQKCLQGNFISMSKDLDYNVPDRIVTTLKLFPKNFIFKGMEINGFQGNFTANFLIPNLLGLGKSVAKGYGCVVLAN